jgi:hypothetical protein
MRALFYLLALLTGLTLTEASHAARPQVSTVGVSVQTSANTRSASHGVRTALGLFEHSGTVFHVASNRDIAILQPRPIQIATVERSDRSRQ